MVKSNLNIFSESVCVSACCELAGLGQIGGFKWVVKIIFIIYAKSTIFTFGKIMLTTYLSVGIVISAVSPLGGETLALAGGNALLGVA